MTRASDLINRFVEPRRDQWERPAREALAAVYPDVVDGVFDRAMDLIREAVFNRPADLLALDTQREADPGWLLGEEMIGYVAYADRFAGRLIDVASHLDYLGELGVTYLHLMPLLKARPGDSDGGYAVMDYRNVEPALGTIDDLADLATALRGRGISLCVDLVVNHTAREHDWAQRAIAGNPRYRSYYRVFPDRTIPDTYEETLWEVFPDTAPGSFTWVEDMQAWVWTTFHEWQWDLNYENPDVFLEMLDIMLNLANHGAEIIRLDAVPWLWKRIGTSSQNLPEAHQILRAWRALLAIAAPSVAFKAEAIVAPDDLVTYLGDADHVECDLAYHNQLMVMGWSALAEGKARLATQALSRLQRHPAHATYVTYVRCHDDIGWAVVPEDADRVGLDAFEHRSFLNSFYAGDFPGSYARGERFQDNPETGDARISGAGASLTGIEEATETEDAVQLERAIKRHILLHALALSYGGIPLLWMGDELAVGNDYSYLDDPRHAGDNRWLHRQIMNWGAADNRTDPDTVAGTVFAALQSLIHIRTSSRVFRSDNHATALWHDNDAVLVFRRDGFLGAANFSESDQSIEWSLLATAGIQSGLDLITQRSPVSDAGGIVVPGLSMVWLVEDPA